MFDSLRTRLYHFLRRSESYTKTDMVYLAKGSFWLILVHIVNALALFTLATLCSRLLSPEHYGAYRYLLSTVAVVGSLSLTGMNSAVLQGTAVGKIGFLRYATRLQLPWHIGLGLITILLSGYYWWHDNLVFATVLLVAGLSTPILYTLNTASAHLNGEKKYAWLASCSIGITSGTALLCGLTVWLTGSYLAMGIVYFISTALLTALTYFIVIKKEKLPIEKCPEHERFGWQMTGVNIIPLVATNLDKMIIFQLLGGTGLAIYYFATIFPEQIRGLLKIIPSLVLPKLSSRTEMTVHHQMLRGVGATTLATTIAVGLYILLAPVLIGIFFPAYLASINYSRLYAVSLIFIAPTMILLTHLQSTKNTRLLSIHNISGAALQISLMSLGAYWYQTTGLIAGIVVSHMVRLVLAWYFTFHPPHQTPTTFSSI